MVRPEGAPHVSLPHQVQPKHTNVALKGLVKLNQTMGAVGVIGVIWESWGVMGGITIPQGGMVYKAAAHWSFTVVPGKKRFGSTRTFTFE